MLDFESNYAYAIKKLWPQQRIVMEGLRKHALLSMLNRFPNWEGAPAAIVVDYANPQGRSADYTTAYNNRNLDGAGDVFNVNHVRDFHYWGVKNDTLETAGSNKGAVMTAIDKQMKGSLRQITNSAGHASYRDGTGTVATIATGGITGNVITLSDAEDIVHFQKGQSIRAVNAGAYRVGSALITNVTRGRSSGPNPIASTITVDNIANITSVTAGDTIVFPGDLNGKMLGVDAWIPATVTSTPFLTVDRSKDSEFLGGVRLDASGMQYKDAFQFGLHASGRGQGEPESIFVHGENYQNYSIEMGSAVQRTQRAVEIGKVTVGFDGFTIAGPNWNATLFSDYDCPHNVAYALELDTWKLYHRGGEFIRMNEKDGNKMSRLDGSLDAIFGNWYYYANIVCELPGHNVRIALGAS